MNEHIYRLLEDIEREDFSEDGENPSAEVLNLARYYLDLVTQWGFEVYHITPGPKGEIAFIFKHVNRHLEFIIYSHRRIVFVYAQELHQAQQVNYTDETEQKVREALEYYLYWVFKAVFDR